MDMGYLLRSNRQNIVAQIVTYEDKKKIPYLPYEMLH